MFAGHTALALLARRARPTIPFAVLFVAAYLPDFLEIGMRLLDVRRIDPTFWSHALVSVGMQGAVVALLVAAVWKDARGGFVTGLAVLSHWPADYLTGLGKPTWPGGPAVGLYLYEHHVADFFVEAGLLVVGWWVARNAFSGVWRRLSVVAVAALVAIQGGYALRDEDPAAEAVGKGDLLRTVGDAIRRLAPREGRASR